MDMERISASLRRDWYLVVAVVVVALIGGAVAIAVMPTRYQAHSQLYVAASGGFGAQSPTYDANLAQDRILSYAQVADSPLLARAVVTRLRLSMDPDDVAREITATVQPLSTVIDVEVVDESPERARDIANAVAGVLDAVVSQVAGGNGAVDGQQIRTSLLRPATTPTHADSPRPVLDLVLAALLGLVAGLALVLLRSAVDRRIRTVAELRAVTGEIPVLGTVSRRGRSGARAREAMAQVRTALTYARARRWSVVVVAAVRGDHPVRETAAALAASLADDGARVCLLDADLRSGTPSDPGLVEVLSGAVSSADAVTTEHPGLDRLGRGGRTDAPSEALGRAEFRALIRALRESYDRVVIAAPAVLDVADALVASASADGIVLVVDLSLTSATDVRDAQVALRTVDVTVLGTLASTRR